MAADNQQQEGADLSPSKQNLHKGSAYSRHLGIDFLDADEGCSRLSMDIQPFHANMRGHVHGGALFSLVDAGMGIALYSRLPDNLAAATIESKINYLKAVTKGQLICESRVIHLGSRTAVLEADVMQDGQPVVRALATFALIPASDDQSR
ncbi:PaaI family thioesterase [Kistimonas scapharcae]|uniref:PaaI family thioesterase n=1 Tax=Kistimonas scapharcae TaxID=1036133 RepID=A0ABP8V2H4_9GAMM